jgi:hypothetical protein
LLMCRFCGGGGGGERPLLPIEPRQLYFLVPT